MRWEKAAFECRSVGEGDILKVVLQKGAEHVISLVLYSRVNARVSAVGGEGRGCYSPDTNERYTRDFKLYPKSHTYS